VRRMKWFTFVSSEGFSITGDDRPELTSLKCWHFLQMNLVRRLFRNGDETAIRRCLFALGEGILARLLHEIVILHKCIPATRLIVASYNICFIVGTMH
jgi:hypothetical protein